MPCHCCGNVHLYAAPKSHSPWPALRAGGKIHRYAGGKCPGVHLNRCICRQFAGGGARASIIYHAMASLILHPFHSLYSAICHPAKRRRHCFFQHLADSLNTGSYTACVEHMLVCSKCSTSTERGLALAKLLLETWTLSRGDSSEVD